MPEHLHIDQAGLPAEIVTAEPTGSETQVVARLAGQEVTCAFRQRILACLGDALAILPDIAAAYLFDTQTGRRIET